MNFKYDLIEYLHKKIYLFFLLIGLIPNSGFTQTGTPFFSTLSMRDGLPTNIISSITQDQYGFLWIGTGNGLARYDGYKFKIFQRSKSVQSLSSNEINVVVAADDHVWIGTWEGLCKVNIRSLEVSRIDLGIKSPVRTLLPGKNNMLWIGTANGLIQYSIDNGKYQLYNDVNSQLSHNMVRSIFEETNGNLWVGTYDGLNVLKKGENTFITIYSNESFPPSFKNHLILDIKPTSAISDSLLWIGTELGLYTLNSRSLDFEKYNNEKIRLSNEVIKYIYTDREQNIWLGTDFGLNIIKTASDAHEIYFHNPKLAYSIANNVIWQVFEDAGGVIWLVTSNGLSRINKFGNFYTYHEITTESEQQPIGNQVKSFLTSSSGKYWLATQHGVIMIDPVTGKKTLFDTSSPANQRLLLNNAFALEEDKLGRIWIGTAGGINIWDEVQSSMTNITADGTNGLNSNYIGKFSKSPDGTFWVSAWEGGIYKVAGNMSEPKKLRFTLVPSFEMGSEKHVYGGGYLWIVEYNELYQVDTATLSKKHIDSFAEAVDRKMVYSIYFSNKGELWAGTMDGLLQYIPATTKTKFHPIHTGNDEIITSINEDKLGNIWTTSNTSLQKYNPEKDLSEFFPLDNNLPLKSFYYGCTSSSPNGELIFGGDNGFITFFPEKVIPNTYHPPVYITNLEINNSSILVNENNNGILLNYDISFTDHLTLKYVQRSASFEFSSLHFWQPSTNMYAYRMEGFEETWNNTSGMKNFAVYSNLPPGYYTFKVRGTNNYGIESDHTASFSFVVQQKSL